MTMLYKRIISKVLKKEIKTQQNFRRVYKRVKSSVSYKSLEYIQRKWKVSSKTVLKHFPMDRESAVIPFHKEQPVVPKKWKYFPLFQYFRISH